MSIIKKLFGQGDHAEGASEDSPEQGSHPGAPRDKAVDSAIGETRESARISLSPQDFAARAERTRHYGKTTTQLRSSTLFEGLLGQDPRLRECIPSIREPLKKIIIDLLLTARVATRRTGSDEIFYQKFDEIKRELAAQGATNRNIMLLAFSTWLMGKDFEFNPAGRVPATAGYPVQTWNITRCSAQELSEPKPRIDAYSSDKITSRKFPLADVFYGLKI